MFSKTISIALVILFLFGLVSCQSSSNPAAFTPPALMTPLAQDATLNTIAPDEQPPFGTEIVIDALDLGTTFTHDNPITDNEQISFILEELLSQFLSQFAQAGWYHFPTDGRDSFWVHFPVAGSDTFDQFLWTRQYPSYAPGFVLPASIVVADGSWGVTQISNGLDNYQFERGGNKPERPTALAELDYFAGDTINSGVFGNTILMRYIYLVQNPEDDLDRGVDISRTFSGWVEEYEGQDVFVLLTHETFPSMRPRLNDNRAVVDQGDIYTYFDLKNGGRIIEKYIYILEGGGSQEDGLRFNQHLVGHYAALPPDVQGIYDQAAEKLRIYLGGK